MSSILTKEDFKYCRGSLKPRKHLFKTEINEDWDRKSGEDYDQFLKNEQGYKTEDFLMRLGAPTSTFWLDLHFIHF